MECRLEPQAIQFIFPPRISPPRCWKRCKCCCLNGSCTRHPCQSQCHEEKTCGITQTALPSPTSSATSSPTPTTSPVPTVVASPCPANIRKKRGTAQKLPSQHLEMSGVQESIQMTAKSARRLDMLRDWQ